MSGAELGVACFGEGFDRDGSNWSAHCLYACLCVGLCPVLLSVLSSDVGDVGDVK